MSQSSRADRTVVLRHMVWRPTELDVDAETGVLRVIEPDGTTTIVTFLPAGAA